MKSYFKDYKQKMQQEEEAAAQDSINFANQDCDISKGLFLKKKVASTSSNNSFKFNFNEEENINVVTDKMEKL